MNKSALIRASSGTPTEIVRALAAQGVEVTLNLVKQVLKNVNRKKQKEDVNYKRSVKPNHGKKATEIRRLLNLGVTPSQIGKRYGDKARNHVKQIAWRIAHPERTRTKPFRARGIKFNLKRLKLVRELDVCDTELPDDYNIPVELDRWTVSRTVQIPTTEQRHRATQDGEGDQEQTVVEVRKLVLEEPSQLIDRNWSSGTDLPLKESIAAMRRQLDWNHLPGIIAEQFTWIDDVGKIHENVLNARLVDGLVRKIEELRRTGATPRRVLSLLIELLDENLPL